jgi:hypothetical protein
MVEPRIKVRQMGNLLTINTIEDDQVNMIELGREVYVITTKAMRKLDI